VIKQWLAALLLTCVLGVVAAPAQRPGPQFAVGVGRSIPTGSFHQDGTGEGFTGSWTALGSVTLPRVRSRLGLRFDVGYAKHGANDRLKADLATALGQPADENTTLLGADASLVYPLKSQGRVVPAVFGGIGVWHQRVTVSTSGATSHNSATKLGWQLGGELAYRMVFLQLRYVGVSAASGFPSVSFFPVVAGVRFGSGAR
jgi:hypothetical protein